MVQRIVIFLCFFQLILTAQPKDHTFDKDSLVLKIQQELEESKQLTSLAYYPEAYDKIWEVLKTSDSLNNPDIKYKAYKNLTLLYSIFYKKDKAISAIDSMFYHAKRSGVYEVPVDKSNLFFAAALTYRMNQEYELAQKHLSVSQRILDSLNTPIKNKIYVLTEQAHLHTLTGNYKESEDLIFSLSDEISDNHDYSSIIYSMLGDLFAKQNRNKEALQYYEKSLQLISEQKIRQGLRVGLLEKTSLLYKELGNYKLAYEQINESKSLGDSLFGSQSQRNKQLFEIKDSYRKSIIANNRIKKEQELKLVNAEKEKLNAQLLFSILLIVISIIASVIVIKLLRNKHQVEKRLAKERAKAEIEIKKKELAVTALQLIEKDKLLEEIKKGLDDVNKDGSNSVEKIKSTIKVNSAKTWEEFETRFIQVNSSFYESLGNKHKNLSRNELKLCALVKLNFSTKEMAQLLGISADSVNKARYRLRKKLDLQRDENLVTYINSI
ncbi:hypothetical protein [Flavicella sp.]|uniref:hypothetical protein n=1 Tax=Flavicella sp. TaxID=2957742 RepID=UPI00262BE452|nr:hypothetical protein [Flavicella sp.]MDG1805142.1 hypothetical protein [Flavicella sp.]MDG2280116.1 hypothetical protein [Flavicella sp.]